MKNRSTTIITMISALFFTVGVGGYLGLFFMVSAQKDAFLEKSLAQVENDLRQESLTALSRTLRDTENDRKSLDTRILHDENVVEFLALIESLGKEQGVGLVTNALTVEPKNDMFETLVMQVNVEGTYGGVVHMLKLMEHLPYQSTLGKVQLENKNDSLWVGTFEMRVTKFKKI